MNIIQYIFDIYKDTYDVKIAFIKDEKIGLKLKRQDVNCANYENILFYTKHDICCIIEKDGKKVYVYEYYWNGEELTIIKDNSIMARKFKVVKEYYQYIVDEYEKEL
jgi:hypothetical protein